MEKVSIICSAYNDEKNIFKVLEGLEGLSYPDLEFIIVDDFSTDQTKEIIIKFIQNKKRFKLISNNRNLGLAASMNRGLDESKGELIIFVQSDCLIRDDTWVEKLISAKKSGSNIGVVASQRKISDKQRLEIGSKLFNTVCPQELINETKQSKGISFFRGKADMIERDILEKTGGFESELFYRSGEDTDFTFKIRNLNKKIVLSSEAVVEYLFSPRQDTVIKGLGKAFLYGSSAAMLFKRWRYDGLRSRNFLFALLSLILILLWAFPYPIYIISLGLFLWGLTIKVKIPMTKIKIPVSFMVLIFLLLSYFLDMKLYNRIALSYVLSSAAILIFGGFRSVEEAFRQKMGIFVASLAFFYGIIFRILLGFGYLIGRIRTSLKF